jgi:hypothetical protein
MTSSTPPWPTLLVLDADPPPRLGRLTGRVRVEHADESSLADQLPTADVLLVWDFASHAVRPPGRARARDRAGCTRRARAWTT